MDRLEWDMHEPPQQEVNIEQNSIETPNIDHLELTYGDGVNTDEVEDLVDSITSLFPRTYRRISQRTAGLPDTINIHLVDPEQHDGCLLCAFPPNKYVQRSDWFRESSMWHELTHISQFKMNSAHDGDWNFLIEGHAEFESAWLSPGVPTDTKYEKSELLNWNGTLEEYNQAHYFVDAFFKTHGRLAFLELLRDSTSAALESKFEDVTGQSFDDFYEFWSPTDDSGALKRDIRYLPMFEYKDGTLQAFTNHINPIPDDITISWDTNGDGSFTKSGKSIEWEPNGSGPQKISIQYQRDGNSVSSTQIIHPPVTVTSAVDAIAPGEEAELTVQLENATEVVIDGLWEGWDIRNYESGGGTFSHNGRELSFDFDSSFSSSVSVTLQPSDKYQVGDYLLSVTASGQTDTSSTTMILQII